MANSVEVSVEPLQECQIQEILLDGQEIYNQPLSMSVNLTRLTHKIDFSKDESDAKGGKPTSEGDKEEEEEEKLTPVQAPQQWPWEGVRNKLRNALTEMNVLLDVLQMAKAKKYLVLDPVPSETPEPKQVFVLLAKKKAVASAGEILKNGAERLRKTQEQMSRRLQSGPRDFHYELLALRQSWRLKKVGKTILGDLSYKSAGSQYWQNGTFEIHKTEPDDGIVDLTDSPAAGGPRQRGLLSVTVPRALEGSAYIHVAIRNMPDSTDLASYEINTFSLARPLPTAELSVQTKLENAQNVVFCKEVFAELAKEAAHSKLKIPHVVLGNQIFIQLFPGVQLFIALFHSMDKQQQHMSMAPAPPPQNQVLEHSLHQLLHEMHHRNSYVPMPHPATSMVGVNKRRRLAGPGAYTREEMVEPQCGTMLEQIIEQARHTVVQQRVLHILDEVAASVQDPVLLTHLSNIATANETLLKITITSVGYENIRTTFSLDILVEEVRACTKDGRYIHMNGNEQDIKTFLASQISCHHFTTAQSIAKWQGWTVVSCNIKASSGVEMNGVGQSLLLQSPKGDRVLQMYFGPQSGISVSMQSLLDRTTPNHKDIFSKKWTALRKPFKTVNVDKIPGRNFAHKLETLMACLSRTPTSSIGTGDPLMDL